MLAADAVGWAGAACLLLAYARVSSRRLTVGVRYHLLNLAGAGGLAVNGAFHHAWPSAGLNLVWLGIGLTALHRTRHAREPSPVDAGRSSPIRGTPDGTRSTNVTAAGSSVPAPARRAPS